MEESPTKYGNITDPISNENVDFKIVQTIIRRQLEGRDTDNWTNFFNTRMGVSEDTSIGVHHLYTMEKTCTNHQNGERNRTEAMCDN